MASEIGVKISEDLRVSGQGPIVILGPNGSGKTRLAVEMLRWNDAHMVAALRNIALSENIGMVSLAEAERNLTRFYERHRSQHWELSNEIGQLFSKLMVENSSSAIAFRDEYLKDDRAKPEETRLMVLQKIWERLFPGRQISFAGYSPKVRSNLGDAESEYSAQQMSDGERVAVYLAARVLDTSKDILIVDEPEVHLHSRLAVQFWNDMENQRPEVRFVYVTHDLSFALSRRDAIYVILKSPGSPEVVDLKDEVPQDVAHSLLSAASFSIHARRIVFCEGDEGKSRDSDVYSAWFQGSETAVIPVGSCRDVSETVVRFADNKLVAGLTAIGIVDRDYWPDTYVGGLPKSIWVLPVHEIENLLCLEGVFSAVAKHLGKCNPGDVYADFIRGAKSAFRGARLTYVVSERFKCRLEKEFLTARNGLKPKSSMDDTEEHYAQSLDASGWQTPPIELFRAEREVVENALGGSAEDFLKVFPGKQLLNEIQSLLGIDPKGYVDLICEALKATDDAGARLHVLGKEVEKALGPELPPRKESPEQSCE